MSPSGVHNVIAGEPADAASGAASALINPATGEEIGIAPDSGPDDVDRAVAAARDAFDGWSRTTPAERSAALRALADALDGDVETLAELEATSAGHPIGSFVEDELPPTTDCLRFFAGAARCLEGRAAGEYVEGYTSFVRREAVGVVG